MPLNSSRSDTYRFEVALSFAGDDKRPVVREVAETLRSTLGDGRVFFDEWFEAELAGHDAHLVLQNIYRKQTRLVVACVCQRYNSKPWCQEEWRAIQAFERELRDATGSNQKRLRLLPVRFGDGEIDGLFDTALVPDVRNRSVAQVATLVLERLRQIQPVTTRSPAVMSGDLSCGMARDQATPPLVQNMRESAWSLTREADILETLGQYEPALSSLEEAARTYTLVARLEPAAWHDVAWCQDRRSHLLQKLGRMNEALVATREAVASRARRT